MSSSPIASWIVAVCNFTASILCFFSITAILTNKTTRSNAFNIYVAFMLLPDALLNMISFTHHANKALMKPIAVPVEVNVFVNFVYFIVNFNANAVVAYEVNKLITQSNMRRRTNPPDLRRVYKQMFCVYLVAIIFALWGALPVSWSLYHVTDPSKGEGKLGSPPGGPFTFVAASGIAYGLFVIPALVYVVCISIRVWAKKLLPRRGKTRMLSVFFLRVVFVFLLFYVPNAALIIYKARLETETARFWLTTTRGLLTAAQASTTLFLVSVKDDIRLALIDQYNRMIGRLCCKISTTTRNVSEVHISGIAIPVSGKELHRKNSETSRTSHLQQSEWFAEDEYDDDDTNKNARTTNAESGHSTVEESFRISSLNMAGELEISRRSDNAV